MSRGFWEGFTVTAGDREKNQKLATKRWREQNLERHKARSNAYSKKWSEENRERRREIGRTYYYRHREQEAVRKAAYQKANKDKVNAISKRYYQRKKDTKQKPRCINCESILKETKTIYCTWCVQTYGTTWKKNNHTQDRGTKARINHNISVRD